MIRLWHRQKTLSPPLASSKHFPVLGLIALETAEQLLQHPHRQALLCQIASLTSLPEQHFVDFVQIAITNFTRFVQRLPTSEAHHHARLDGMLDYGLQITATALLIRRGHLLPQGAEPEEIARKQDVWTYAILTAALLHDVGKLVVDRVVTLHDAQGKAIGPWTPWAGPMDAIKACAGYRIEFSRNREPKLQERVTPLIVHHLLPPCALSWLASDPEAFATWLAAITGDYNHAGLLGEIICQAGSEVVGRHAGADDGEPPPTPRAKPLHDILLAGLRYLLSADGLTLNRQEAAGWLVDNDLWLASQRTVEALRAHLVTEGHTTICHSNEHVFALLQEQGIVLPCKDQAVWCAKVTGEGWEQELTLLRIPAQKIWPALARRPDPFSGTVTESHDDDTESQQVVSQALDPGTGCVEDAEACGQRPATAMSVFPDLNALSQEPSLPPLPAATVCKEVEKEAAEDPVVQAKASFHKEPSTAVSVGEDDPGQKFLAWLQEGLTAGSIEVNDTNARVYIVTEGVLLVSPGIFKDFVAGHPTLNDWNAVQKRFLKLKLHRKTAIGTTIHRYQVKNLRKKHINGLLIPDVTHLFRERSAPLPSSRLVPDIE